MYMIISNFEFMYMYLFRVNIQIAWIYITRIAEWKPIQFMGFVFVYRIFEKLKAFEPPVSPTFTVSDYGS